MTKKLYTGIDLWKVICAILIVYMHCYCFEPGGAWVKDVLSTIGVPFFFIASGFFYSEGLKNAQDPKAYFKKYAVRVTQMYLAWTIITLPVAWYNLSLAHSDYSVFLKIIYLFRCLFLVGSVGIYWYLLALIYNSIILYYTIVKKKEKWLYIISVLLFIIGLVYEAGYLSESFIGNLIHVGFGSSRNFLNVGLFYMCIGRIISRYNYKSPGYIPILLILSLIVEYCLMSYTKIQFMVAVSAILLFLYAYGISIDKLTKYSYHIRKISTAIYLGHFPFILVFDYYLKRGTFIDMSASLIFAVTLYLIIEKFFPKKVSRILYG